MGRLLLASLVLIPLSTTSATAARLSRDAPASERELDAATRLEDRRCNPWIGLLLPGIGQVCHRKTTTGVTLMALSAAELGTLAWVANAPENSFNRETAITLLGGGLQNLWIYGIADNVIEQQLADGKLYVPEDTLWELVQAPFNPSVISRPAVWGGTIVAFGLATGLSLLLDQNTSWRPSGRDPVYLGRSYDPEVGYPLIGATSAVLFTHVAIGEEALFRGVAQSAFTRTYGPWRGWAGGSLLFGAAHIPNAIALEGQERTDYLRYAVPYITLTGSYMGLLYMWSDYSLAPPVAMHFWYNFLLAAADAIWNPEDGFYAQYAMPF